MNFKIKETRAEYKVTQKELSEITEIPLRTIENWESGKRTPSPWVEKLIDSHLKQYPKNKRGIITSRKNTYTIEQIKAALLPLTLKYEIDKLVLFGSYARGNADSLSDIDLVVDGNLNGLIFFGLLEEVSQIFVKDVDLIFLPEIEKDSDFYKAVMKGIILYER
jgi:predicted nucleotidyltransferase